MSEPFDETKPPSGIRQWEPETAEGGYISRLNEPEKLLSDEQWEARQAALGRLARQRRRQPPDDVAVS